MAGSGLVLKKAQRKKAFLRLGVAAPSGAGKTAGSLVLAYGMMKKKYPDLPDSQLWEKIAIIDSENGSGELYVNMFFDWCNLKVGEYLAITLTAPFTAEKYISAIDICEKNNVEVVIIDSTTHLWAGEGGLLEQQNNITLKSKSGNSYMAWREVTPEHNRFVESMLQANAHIIATIRSKVEYVQSKDENGSVKVTKVGLKPVQRDGMEYEFTVFLDINENHLCSVSKDRTGLLDGKVFKMKPQIGEDLMDWLDSGTDAAPTVLADTRTQSDVKGEISAMISAHPNLKESFREIFKKYNADGNPNQLSFDQMKSALAEMQSTVKENN